jgi:hypothetical protein
MKMSNIKNNARERIILNVGGIKVSVRAEIFFKKKKNFCGTR